MTTAGGRWRRQLDVLIPTYGRPSALAVTLAALESQTLPHFRVLVSDQTAGADVADAPALAAPLALLAERDCPVQVVKHLPRRGLAEQRDFLLSLTDAPFALYLDDDVICAPDLLQRLLGTVRAQRCGFVGSAPIGLSFVDDVRPDEQDIEFWDGPVRPETVRPEDPSWQRWRLHNAANVHHVSERLGLTPARERLYKVAWVGGCVLYDVAKLRAVGGFGFWRDLPPNHAGEDVVAQLRVMERFGGCGLLPSGAYHQELPTTVSDRTFDAVDLVLTPRQNQS